MADLLSNEEKIQIIESHQKNVAYNEFNTRMSLLEEQAKPQPDANTVATLSSQLAVYLSQSAALDQEKQQYITQNTATS